MSGLFGRSNPPSQGQGNYRRPDPASFASRYGSSPAPPQQQPLHTSKGPPNSYERKSPLPSSQYGGGQESFTAMSCPDDALALTNRIIFNPADFPTGSFVQIKGNYVCTVQSVSFLWSVYSDTD